MITYEITQTDCSIKCFAMDDGQKIGHCEILKVLETADVINIDVGLDYRRQGIGRELCERLIAFGIEQGMETLTLEVRKSNLAAQNLYKKLGFHEISIREKYYQTITADGSLQFEDGIVMQLICS